MTQLQLCLSLTFAFLFPNSFSYEGPVPHSPSALHLDNESMYSTECWYMPETAPSAFHVLSCWASQLPRKIRTITTPLCRRGNRGSERRMSMPRTASGQLPSSHPSHKPARTGDCSSIRKQKLLRARLKAWAAAHVSEQPAPEPHIGSHRKLSPTGLPASSHPKCLVPWSASPSPSLRR